VSWSESRLQECNFAHEFGAVARGDTLDTVSAGPVDASGDAEVVGGLEALVAQLDAEMAGADAVAGRHTEPGGSGVDQGPAARPDPLELTSPSRSD
jgi:hypothetical protein